MAAATSDDLLSVLDQCPLNGRYWAVFGLLSVTKRAPGQRPGDRPDAAAQQNGRCRTIGQMPLRPDHRDEDVS